MVRGGEKIMCGRYSLFFDDEYDYDIAKMMDILKQHYPQTEIKQGEIYPTNTAPVWVKQNSEIAPVPYSWGFPNFRSKGVIINSRRKETLQRQSIKSQMRYTQHRLL